MTCLLIALVLSAVLAVPALAAPGDARLVQGTLEWPATLAREPVVIVRSDDGHVYYADVTDAVRHRTDGLRAGGRVSLLAIESAKPYEVTAIVIGTGDAAGLARALSQGLASSPPASAPAAAAVPSPPAPAATTPASTPVTTPAAPAATTPASTPATTPVAAPPAATPAAPAVATTPEPVPAPAAAPPAPASGPPAAPTVVIMAPAPPTVSAPTAPTTPTVVPATATTTAAGTTPPGPRRVLAPTPTTFAGSRGQWSRLDGTIESVGAGTLVLKTDDGSVAYVDISQLSPNVTQVLRLGSAVTVYGYPLEQKFEAAGYIQTNR
jgi:hypothetical protein